MPDNAHEQHLRELLAFPREELNITFNPGWHRELGIGVTPSGSHEV